MPDIPDEVTIHVPECGYFTEEEHDTRAMLLGRWYDPTDGTYVRDHQDVSQVINSLIDAMSLERVTWAEATNRKAANGKSFYPHEWRDKND